MRQEDLASAVAICMQVGVPPYLEGIPGVGKTAMIEQICQEIWKVPWHVEIGSISDPTDMKGIPIIGPIIEAFGSSFPTTVFAPPSWAVDAAAWAESAENSQQIHGVVFLDELPDSPPAVQSSALRALLPDARGFHHVGPLAIPPSIVWVAAGNPLELSTGGWGLRPAIANRLCHLSFPADSRRFVQGLRQGWPAPDISRVPDGWMENTLPKWRELVATYIERNGDELARIPERADQRSKGWPSPRSWAFGTRVLAGTDAAGASPLIGRTLLEGCIGAGSAHAFLEWVTQQDLGDPKEILADPDKAKLPERSDQASALLSNLAGYVKHLDADEQGKGLEAALVFAGRVGDQSGDDLILGMVRRMLQDVPPERWTPNFGKARKVLTRLGALDQEVRKAASQTRKS
jgi:hypothetical protein